VYIKKIQLENYRNYKSLELELSDELNIFVGNNAQGKTNILEALFVGGFGKSFRTSKDQDLVMHDQLYAKISLEAVREETDQYIDIRLTHKKKKEIRVNNYYLNRLSDLIGRLNIIIFSPEDLRLIKEGPSDRRKFIDRELSHISPKYCHQLIDYSRLLKQRNQLLKDNFSNPLPYESVEIWDEQLAEKGTHIILSRNTFIKKLDTLSRLMHRRLTNGKEDLEINYICNIKTQNLQDYDTIYKEFKKLLKKQFNSDSRRGFTSVGPHRDDIGLFIDKIDIRHFGSQGQQRTAALSMKLSEIEIVKGETGENPILLLDDVMSELDPSRQNDLIRSLRHIQTIITVTEINSLIDQYLDHARIYHVAEGTVKLESKSGGS